MSTLFRGGTVVTSEHPSATAFVVDGPRIVWIGDEQGAAAHADAVDGVVDLAGGLVTPGLVDAHVHVSHTGQQLRSADLTDATSRDDALDRIAAHARRAPGTPVFAPNWDETRWPDPTPFTMAELDRAGGGSVVYAPRIDFHSAVLSSALVAESGVDRLPGWEPTGRVTLEAHEVAGGAMDGLRTVAERRTDIETALRRAAALGIVCVHENNGPKVASAEDLADVIAVAEQPGLPQVIPYWAELVHDEQQARDTQALHGAHGLAGDLNIDGSIGSRTARLRVDYADAPGERGQAFLTVAEVRDHIAACTLAGIQGGFHVIGDAGVDTAIEGIEAAAGIVGAEAIRRNRHRLEHVEGIDAAGAARLARLGVIASVQPAFDALWGGPSELYAVRLGPERGTRLNPFREMLAAGLELAGGSDAPVTPLDGWGGLRGFVDHRTPGQGVTPAQALEAHTVAGWQAARIDGRGRIRTGGEATFVVWSGGAVTGGLPDPMGPEPTASLTVRDGLTLHRG
ncbi:amidohydrolase [Actinomycetota bacterium]